MPAIYRVHRSSDGPTVGTDLPRELLSGRVTDEGKPGQLMVSHYSALLVDGEVVPLRHPEEERELIENGETQETAQKKGTLLLVDNCVCLDCGVVYPRAIRNSPRGVGVMGCSMPLIAMIATTTWLGKTFDFDGSALFFGALVAIAWLVVHSFIVDKLDQRREATVYPPLPCYTCPYCQSENSRIISDMLKKPVKINRQQTITVTVAGKS